MTTTYTAIFGKYDQLGEPEAPGRYVAFTDQDFESERWEVRRYEPVPDSVRAARWFKTHPHVLCPGETTVWVDGKVTPMAPAEQIVEAFLGDADIGTFAHPRRWCAYQEADACQHWGLGESEKIAWQVLYYRNRGFPYEMGLAETRVVVRPDTPKVREFNRLWWNQIERFSARDQISFNYCCWKLGLDWKAVSIYVAWAHPAFEFRQHLDDLRPSLDAEMKFTR